MKKATTKADVKQKRPPKTLKEKQFAYKYIVEQKPATIAALEVYDVHQSKDPYNTASVIATENLRKLSFEHYFQAAGLTDEIIAQNVTHMALQATKRDHFSGEYEPDYNVRLKATDLAVKVMGKMPKEQGDINLQVNNIQPVLVKFLDGDATTNSN